MTPEPSKHCPDHPDGPGAACMACRDARLTYEAHVTKQRLAARNAGADDFRAELASARAALLIAQGLIERALEPFSVSVDGLVQTKNLDNLPLAAISLEVTVDPERQVALRNAMRVRHGGHARHVIVRDERRHARRRRDQNASRSAFSGQRDPLDVPCVDRIGDSCLPEVDDRSRRLKGDAVDRDAAVRGQSRAGHGDAPLDPGAGAGSPDASDANVAEHSAVRHGQQAAAIGSLHFALRSAELTLAMARLHALDPAGPNLTATREAIDEALDDINVAYRHLDERDAA